MQISAIVGGHQVTAHTYDIIERKKNMNNKIKLLDLETRIELLTERPRENDKIVAKLKRRLRNLLKEIESAN